MRRGAATKEGRGVARQNVLDALALAQEANELNYNTAAEYVVGQPRSS